MKNPIIKKFLENGLMEEHSDEIYISFNLSEMIFHAMSAENMKAEFHFKQQDGTLVFDKILGRDCNGDFFNEENGNLEQRKAEIKKVIVNVLLSEFNK